ncbi:hypothetical protein TREES_T100006231 [Tupaia chinensis]|uniref:Uncharacterized protein n=1 Tax=Tupaia chinensis TaxID=246437 RepID=L9LCL6_TUPCH|nr:hypothetical protein TREES_T100006231 [Tupaia chinensis]
MLFAVILKGCVQNRLFLKQLKIKSWREGGVEEAIRMRSRHTSVFWIGDSPTLPHLNEMILSKDRGINR